MVAGSLSRDSGDSDAPGEKPLDWLGCSLAVQPCTGYLTCLSVRRVIAVLTCMGAGRAPVVADT